MIYYPRSISQCSRHPFILQIWHINKYSSQSIYLMYWTLFMVSLVTLSREFIWPNGLKEDFVSKNIDFFSLVFYISEYYCFLYLSLTGHNLVYIFKKLYNVTQLLILLNTVSQTPLRNIIIVIFLLYFLTAFRPAWEAEYLGCFAGRSRVQSWYGD